jgi:hypothetical protein
MRDLQPLNRNDHKSLPLPLQAAHEFRRCGMAIEVRAEAGPLFKVALVSIERTHEDDAAI